MKEERMLVKIAVYHKIINKILDRAEEMTALAKSFSLTK